MGVRTFKIYSIENINYDEIIAKYHQLCEEGDFKCRGGLSVYEIKDLERETIRKPRNGVQDETIILNKAKYLVHTIAYRQLTNIENNVNGVSIRAELLQDVIGRDATELLRALNILGYIKISYHYTIGKESRRYKILGNIHQTIETNGCIENYVNKAKGFLKKEIREQIDEKLKSTYGDTFVEAYIKNLNKFKIDEEHLNKIANRQKKQAKYIIIILSKKVLKMI